MVRNARRMRRLLALGSAALLLGAILPNVFYMGHIAIPGVATRHEHSFSEQEARDHTAHCHFGPLGCSDHTHPSTSSWSLAGDIDPAMGSVVKITPTVWDAVDVAQAIPPPPEKPPQAL